jgi:hypothetical protein
MYLFSVEGDFLEHLSSHFGEVVLGVTLYGKIIFSDEGPTRSADKFDINFLERPKKLTRRNRFPLIIQDISRSSNIGPLQKNLGLTTLN